MNVCVVVKLIPLVYYISPYVSVFLSLQAGNRLMDFVVVFGCEISALRLERPINNPLLSKQW